MYIENLFELKEHVNKEYDDYIDKLKKLRNIPLFEYLGLNIWDDYWLMRTIVDDVVAKALLDEKIKVSNTTQCVATKYCLFKENKSYKFLGIYDYCHFHIAGTLLKYGSNPQHKFDVWVPDDKSKEIYQNIARNLSESKVTFSEF